MTRKVPALLFSFACLGSFACGGPQHVAPDASPGIDLAGTWASACTDPGSGQAFRLSFDIKPTTWTLAYEVFADAACAAPLLVVNIDGPYEITGPSNVVPTAREARFGFAHKTVTPLSDGAVGFLPQACGGGTYVVGTPTDIAAGCPGLGAYPIATCPADFDIVARDGDQLRFGQRPPDNNMCTADKRPTSLSQAVLTRR
jgi:hypothetical protein